MKIVYVLRCSAENARAQQINNDDKDRTEKRFHIQLEHIINPQNRTYLRSDGISS